MGWIDCRRESNVAAGVLLALVLGTGGCGEAPAVSSVADKPSTAVVVEEVALRSLTPTLTVPGLVEAQARIELHFRVDGFVERFHVDEGDRVEADTLLAELDPTDLELEVSAARASLERARAHARDAQRTWERQRTLYAKGSTSRQAHDRAKSAWEMARAEERQAQVQLRMAEDRRGKARLLAPVAGMIERRLLDAHELAAAQKPVLVLTVLDTVKVRAAVADAHLSRLRAAGPATVSTALWPDRTFHGQISHIDVAADPATRTVPFEVEVANSDLALRPELVVEVSVPLGEPEPSVVVPLSAVLRDADTTPFCFVAAAGEAGDRVQRRAVELGAVHGERVAIARGLAAGERLIVKGQHFVRAGDPVSVVEVVP